MLRGVMWCARRGYPEEENKLNINERVLFPELYGMSRWLNRHYSLRIRIAVMSTSFCDLETPSIQAVFLPAF